MTFLPASQRLLPLMLPLVLFSLAACGVEQSQPEPVVPDERWGHLPQEDEPGADPRASTGAAPADPGSRA